MSSRLSAGENGTQSFQKRRAEEAGATALFNKACDFFRRAINARFDCCGDRYMIIFARADSADVPQRDGGVMLCRNEARLPVGGPVRAHASVRIDACASKQESRRHTARFFSKKNKKRLTQ